MDKALQDEVSALIAGAIKPLTETLGTVTKAIEPVAGLASQVGDLGKNLKIVADTVAALPPAAATEKGKGKDAEGAGGAKFLTAEDLAKALDSREAARNGSAKRDAFLATKLKDLPVAYRNLLGSDESKWATEEQTIRTQFQGDLKGMGLTAPAVGGAPATQALTEIAKPHELPTAEFAKRFLPKPPGEVPAADQK